MPLSLTLLLKIFVIELRLGSALSSGGGGGGGADVGIVVVAAAIPEQGGEEKSMINDFSSLPLEALQDSFGTYKE